MNTISDVLPLRLAGTSMEGPLSGLHRIYDRIDAEQTAWIEASPYRCPESCGSCCDEFEPDLLAVEALYLAAWILRNAPHRLDDAERNAGRKGCVLADPDSRWHCTVYAGRPLVCRLFAFSGDRAKDGTVRYRPCSRMKAEGARTLDHAALLDLHGVLPPAMGDLATEASFLMPGGSGERSPLREALPRAADKIRLLTDFSAFSSFAPASDGDGDGDGEDDNPGGAPPTEPMAG
ncbi:MAG: hypothetical protein A2Z99_00995 [Treponema sp. GWB1_62_6]|nr:MAG: hypothetical protein A2Z99_00995 [Treponema sp. GWB1_62_6]OHE68164.1 MAG: hypothetical protein A2001_12380 [Treponema sp. GWC1_61_84]OHE72554.1 MAG: hypothetical protein A2413_14645 [Treponema sp. RIFOXYC1_FULL_61_9]HCM28337.1 YkgJ family cysteine cluster protein [Treponema sp.]